MDVLLGGPILGHPKNFGSYLSETGCCEGFCAGQRNDLTYIFK